MTRTRKTRTALLPQRKAPRLTDHQRSVLKALAVFGGWARPMDIGGRDGSHHTATMRRLLDKRLVERLLRGSLLNQIRGSELYDQLAKIKRPRNAPRGSYLYRITPEGRRAIQ